MNDYPDYTPGPEGATVLLHVPDPPGQQITYKLLRVPATIGMPNTVFMSAPIPIPGSQGFTNVPLAVPGGWNIR